MKLAGTFERLERRWRSCVRLVQLSLDGGLLVQFKPFAPNIEVYGAAIELMLNGFRILPSVATAYLVKYGLTSGTSNGRPEFDRNRWHSQDAWLRMFEAISDEVGSNTLFEIGRQVGITSLTAATTKDIYSRMRSIDIGYHAAHRRDGKIMYDPTTGAMLDGIGHYSCTLLSGAKTIVSVCETPYACAFDFGMIAATAAQLDMRAKTIHDDRARCRKRGGDSCTYVTTW
jgi:hypothetical protein